MTLKPKKRSICWRKKLNFIYFYDGFHFLTKSFSIQNCWIKIAIKTFWKISFHWVLLFATSWKLKIDESRWRKQHKSHRWVWVFFIIDFLMVLWCIVLTHHTTLKSEKFVHQIIWSRYHFIYCVYWWMMTRSQIRKRETHVTNLEFSHW